MFRFLLVAAGVACVSQAQEVTTVSGIDFVTVGAAGNAALPVDGNLNQASGRGRVDYSFNIARTPVTTGQWIEYVNTFSMQSDDMRLFGMPTRWGATVDFNYTGPGIKWRLADVEHADLLPVSGLSWREAAQYANWLHNDRSSDLSAIEGGAYDTSTWGPDPDNQPFGVTDAPYREEGARYWIPGLDEWLKAVYYDPEKDGTGGWWSQPGRSDDELIPGLPGEGETSAGLDDADLGLSIPYGSYDTQTAWGLKDVSGGVVEWIEDYIPNGVGRERLLKGTRAGNSNLRQDQIDSWGSGSPDSDAFGRGFRIATSVPATPTVSVFLVLPIMIRRKR